MADEQKPPIFGEQLAAQLAKTRKDTLDAVTKPSELPVFRPQDDGSVLLRSGVKVGKRS